MNPLTKSYIEGIRSCLSDFQKTARDENYDLLGVDYEDLQDVSEILKKIQEDGVPSYGKNMVSDIASGSVIGGSMGLLGGGAMGGVSGLIEGAMSPGPAVVKLLKALGLGAIQGATGAGIGAGFGTGIGAAAGGVTGLFSNESDRKRDHEAVLENLLEAQTNLQK